MKVQNEKNMGVIKKNVNILKIFTQKPDLKGWKGVLKYVLKRVLFIFFASSIFMTLLYRFVPVPITPLMLIRSMEQLTDGKVVQLNGYPSRRYPPRWSMRSSPPRTTSS